MSTVDLRWRKSSFSDNGNGNCVEIAIVASAAVVRDSKNPDGDALTIGESAWERLRSAVR